MTVQLRWLPEVLGCAITVDVISLGTGVGIIPWTASVRMRLCPVGGRVSRGRMMQTGMTSRLVALCFDARDPLRLARFWAAALGWEVDGESHDEIGLVP